MIICALAERVIVAGCIEAVTMRNKTTGEVADER
jgi:hypothetical protein